MHRKIINVTGKITTDALLVVMLLGILALPIGFTALTHVSVGTEDTAQVLSVQEIKETTQSTETSK